MIACVVKYSSLSPGGKDSDEHSRFHPNHRAGRPHLGRRPRPLERRVRGRVRRRQHLPRQLPRLRRHTRGLVPRGFGTRRERRREGRAALRPSPVAGLLRRRAASRDLVPGRRAHARRRRRRRRLGRADHQGRHEAGRVAGPSGRGAEHRPVRPRAPRSRARDRDRPQRVRRRLERAESERWQLPRRRGHAEGRADLREAGELTMRILAVSGSLRESSFNTSLLRAALEAAPDGVELELWEGIGELPFYDEDLETDAPDSVRRLREDWAAANAILFSTPEYNGSVPGGLKNAIDWASRPPIEDVLRNKAVAVVGASTGPFGALWAQQDLKRILGIAGARVIGTEVTASRAPERFASEGRLLAGEVFEQLRLHLTTLASEAVAAPDRVAA